MYHDRNIQEIAFNEETERDLGELSLNLGESLFSSKYAEAELMLARPAS
jgi:hypothetical protein